MVVLGRKVIILVLCLLICIPTKKANANEREFLPLAVPVVAPAVYELILGVSFLVAGVTYTYLAEPIPSIPGFPDITFKEIQSHYKAPSLSLKKTIASQIQASAISILRSAYKSILLEIQDAVKSSGGAGHAKLERRVVLGFLNTFKQQCKVLGSGPLECRNGAAVQSLISNYPELSSKISITSMKQTLTWDDPRWEWVNRNDKEVILGHLLQGTSFYDEIGDPFENRQPNDCDPSKIFERIISDKYQVATVSRRFGKVYPTDFEKFFGAGSKNTSYVARPLGDLKTDLINKYKKQEATDVVCEMSYISDGKSGYITVQASIQKPEIRMAVAGNPIDIPPYIKKSEQVRVEIKDCREKLIENNLCDELIRGF